MKSNFNKQSGLSLKSIRDKKEIQLKYSFEISQIELVKNEFGKNDIVISKIKVLDENGKYVKFAKLNEELIKAIKLKGVLKI